jgi:hypothetical protein
MQKLNKTFMHVWISVVSLGAFVFSWLILAYTPKPSTSSVLVTPTPQINQVSVPDLPGLKPIPTLNNYLNSGSSQVQKPNKSTITVQPRLRTRGS